MRFLFFAISLFVLNWSPVSLASGSVTVKIQMRPAGSFEIKTQDIKGQAVQSGNQVSASNVIVDLRNLKTGIELRDEHTLNYLDVKNYPEAILLSASGSGGNGTGKIKIRGITKDIAGTYIISNGMLEAEFPLKLADFNITGVRYMNVGVKEEIKLKVSLPVRK